MAWNEHTAIEEAAIAAPSVLMVRLPEDEQTETLHRIMKRFLLASDVAWWWEVLAVPSRTLEGYSAEDIPNICSDPDVEIFFLPCDTRPLLVYRTTPRSSLMILNECPFFEYALVAHDLSWIIIENHHGAFIVAGDFDRLNLPDSEQGGGGNRLSPVPHL